MKRLAFAAALLVSSAPGIAELAVPAEGWASWEVAAIDGAENRCCLQWRRKPASHIACDLDGVNHGYGSSSHNDTVRAMRVYARFGAGKLESLRALGPACEVSSRTPIRDLGAISHEESARWLSAQLPRSG